jgi:hypothetical protein
MSLRQINTLATGCDVDVVSEVYQVLFSGPTTALARHVPDRINLDRNPLPLAGRLKCL